MARRVSALLLGALPVAAVLLLAAARQAAAWDRHDLITRVVLRSAPWLDLYPKIAVLPASGSECPRCDKDLYNPDFIPLFIDRLPGETTSAREVLVRYVDEPDWGLDDAIQLSPLQALAGGSKGFRHQFYYYITGVARVGEAPDRVTHFYDLAVAAYVAGDKYWAFRQLARALHYLQDMGQPLHTRPFLYSWLTRTRLDVSRTTTLATNIHFGYERLVEWHLHDEIRRDDGPLLRALRKPPVMKFYDPDTAARALAEYSSNRAPDLLKDLDAFLPKRIKSTRQVVAPRHAELHPGKPAPSYRAILASTVRSFEVTAGAMLSVLEMARREFQKADRARLQEE